MFPSNGQKIWHIKRNCPFNLFQNPSVLRNFSNSTFFFLSISGSGFCYLSQYCKQYNPLNFIYSQHLFQDSCLLDLVTHRHASQIVVKPKGNKTWASFFRSEKHGLGKIALRLQVSFISILSHFVCPLNSVFPTWLFFSLPSQSLFNWEFLSPPPLTIRFPSSSVYSLNNFSRCCTRLASFFGQIGSTIFNLSGLNFVL